jgi:uncharacterized protein (TIGR00730 family)
MSNKLKRICVYCGSNSGIRSEYLESAIQLGKFLAEQEIELVYGGAKVGLMGAVATAAINNGGKVIGVMPEPFIKNFSHNSLTELYAVPTMHERKKTMFDLSDGFIALPGGMGTIEEIFEILTWGQLGFHEKPCGLLNVCGYFDNMLKFVEHSINQQFVKQEYQSMILVESEIKNLLVQFENYKPIKIKKWIN